MRASVAWANSFKLQNSAFADCDVVAVGIAEGELASLRVGVHVRLFFEASDERASSLEREIEIVDAEEQQESVAGGGAVGARQRRMVVVAPAVNAEQNSSVGIENLAEVIVRGASRRLAEERLVPLKTRGHVCYSDDRPGALHGFTVSAGCFCLSTWV